jgi:uncharacterized membrane protein
MNGYDAHVMKFGWTNTFEHILFHGLQAFRLTLDSISLKTFSKIAWRWRHSKLKRYGMKVIKINEEDLVDQFGCSRQKIKKILTELREKHLIDWEIDENAGVVCWLADKGQGILKESNYL